MQIKPGKLSDDELDAVAGGATGESSGAAIAMLLK